ncbi:MAG: CD225/dispanin family protein [Planctomycetota bacterium]|nr:CD225/dispanin family protein [Planctomycetota bacterium]
MKDCIHCFREIEEDAPFCPYCGHAQEKSEHEPRIQPPPPNPVVQEFQTDPQPSASDGADDIFEQGFAEDSPKKSPEPKKRETGAPRRSGKPFRKSPRTHSDIASNYSKRSFKSNIIPAILVTILCCLPLGIVAIVFSVMAIGEKDKGDMIRASKYAGYSRNATTAAIILGVLSILMGLAGTCA